MNAKWSQQVQAKSKSGKVSQRNGPCEHTLLQISSRRCCSLLCIAPHRSRLLQITPNSCKQMQMLTDPGRSGLLLDALTALVCFQIASNCSRRLQIAADCLRWFRSTSDRYRSFQIAPNRSGLFQIAPGCCRSCQIAPECSRAPQIVPDCPRSFQILPEPLQSGLCQITLDRSRPIRVTPDRSASLSWSQHECKHRCWVLLA